MYHVLLWTITYYYGLLFTIMVYHHDHLLLTFSLFKFFTIVDDSFSHLTTLMIVDDS